MNTPMKNTLSIRGRLFAGFAAISCVILVAFSVVLVKISLSKSFTAHVIDTDLPAHEATYDLGFKITTTNDALKEWMLLPNQMLSKTVLSTWDMINALEIRIDSLKPDWNNPDYQAKWQQIKTLLSQLKVAQEKILAEGNPRARQVILAQEVTPLTHRILDILDGPLNENGSRMGGLFDVQLQKLNSSADEIVTHLSAIQLVELGMMLTVIGLSILIAWMTAKTIVTPLSNAIDIAKRIANGERNLRIETTSTDETGHLLTALDQMQQSILESERQLKVSESHTRELFDEIVKKANLFSSHSAKVAAGDLRERLSSDSNDEMGRLGKDLNTMTENLSIMAQQITEASHNMVATLEQVKHSVDVQSSGASEQASSINQITASLGEIEKSSNQTIEKAKALGEAADRTREKGQMGLEAVEQSVLGMKEVKDKVQIIAQTILDLSNKTQQVGEITAVVNGLAQQSKMLALNASIEAAKAGEAGKGFAVVASEVKTLAEQSEQSTAQVQKILEDIRHATEKAVMATEEGTKGVDYGTRLVEQTGDVVRSLSEVISETTVASQQIEAAVRQESIGIEQITVGMNEINQVTSEFVESVKQTTEAMNGLATISHNLKEHVDVYKT